MNKIVLTIIVYAVINVVLFSLKDSLTECKYKFLTYMYNSQ